MRSGDSRLSVMTSVAASELTALCAINEDRTGTNRGTNRTTSCATCFSACPLLLPLLLLRELSLFPQNEMAFDGQDWLSLDCQKAWPVTTTWKKSLLDSTGHLNDENGKYTVCPRHNADLYRIDHLISGSSLTFQSNFTFLVSVFFICLWLLY